MSWLLFTIELYVAMALAVLFYARRIKGSRFSDPIFQFVGFLTLFTLPLPIRACATGFPSGDITPHLPELLPYLPVAVLLCAFSLPLFVLAYYSKTARTISAEIWRPKRGSHYYFAFLVVAGISFVLVLLLSGGNVLRFILLGYNSTAYTYGRGYLAVGFSWMFVAVMLLICRYSTYRQRRDLIFFLLGLTVLLTVELIMGNRGHALYMIIAVLIYWHLAVRRVSFTKAAAIGLVTFVFMNLFGFLRGSSYESLSDVLDRTIDSFTVMQAEGSTSEYSTYTLTGGEFAVPFETFPQMIKSVGSEIPPMWGASYARAPLFFIPSAVYAGRPSSLTHWYMETFYGQGWGLNQGRAFYFLSEGYLNFGPPGVVLIMLFWGLALGVLCHYVRLAKFEPRAVLIFALCVAFIMGGVAGDFSSIIVGLPEQYLGIAVFGIWLTGRNARSFRPVR
jgi:oligosaccharide repeat unit polymerase